MEPEDPDDDDEIDRLLDELHIDADDFTEEEAEAYLDGVERAYAMLPDPGPLKLLPPELQDLYDDIRGIARMRESFLPDAKWLVFEGFEAHDVRRGGMGLVIKARDTTLDRWVAIKLWLKAGAEAQEALLAEARVLAKFRHPNVVGVYGTGQWQNRVYFVMEWVEGQDFHEWLQTRRPWVDVRDAFVLAAAGLAAAHEAGIQHRDFKPANILMGEDGQVLVADFGVADSLEGLDGELGPELEGDEFDLGGIVGTPSYMAPERLRGGRGDARSDQYSFCVALWRGLYGKRPYGGETREEVLEQIDLGELRVDEGARVPRWLAEVVRRGLSVNPDERYASMHELIKALLADASGGPVTLDDAWVVGGRGPGRSDPRVLNSPWRTGFFAGMLVTVLGAFGWGRFEPKPERSAAPVATHSVQKQDEPLEPPCAEVPGVELEDATLLEVCESIRDGHYKAADALWHDTYRLRYSAGADDQTLGTYSIVVAATFVDQAERIHRIDKEAAREAAFMGGAWAMKATVLVPDYRDWLSELNYRAVSLSRNDAAGDH